MTSRRRKILIGVPVVLVAAAFALWTPDAEREVLEAKYLAHREDLRSIAGTTLHVRDTGPRNAPALIFLHGFGASLHTWEPWARALDSTYRVIRFDLPGSGLSAPDATNDYTDTRSMQLLLALMDSLHVSRASLIGNSMGGRIAWRFAAAHPERVERLVLSAPDGFASPGFEYGKPAEIPATLPLMRFVLPKSLLRLSLEPAYADSRSMTDSLATRYYDLMLAPGARSAMLARMEQTVLTDPVPVLRRILAPTLLLWGEKDAMIPVANAQDYLKAIPNVRLVTLPNAGHLPFEEIPAAALKPVRAFLEPTCRPSSRT